MQSEGINSANAEGKVEQSKKPLDDPEELNHFKNVVSAFFNYTVIKTVNNVIWSL